MDHTIPQSNEPSSQDLILGRVLASYFPFGILRLCSLCSSAIKNKNKIYKKTTKIKKNNETNQKVERLIPRLAEPQILERQKNDGFYYYYQLVLS